MGIAAPKILWLAPKFDYMKTPQQSLPIEYITPDKEDFPRPGLQCKIYFTKRLKFVNIIIIIFFSKAVFDEKN